MTWMDEGMIDPNLREVEVTEDLYIIVADDDYIDLHSKQLDLDCNPGVIINVNEELDKLIEALMQLRKEVEEDF